VCKVPVGCSDSSTSRIPDRTEALVSAMANRMRLGLAAEAKVRKPTVDIAGRRNR